MKARKCVREVIVVEGRYDKHTLSQAVEASILSLEGFGIFNDPEKKRLLRRLASQRGLIVLTDSDGAGLVLRNYLKGLLPKEQLKHAYIPEIPGKERRKRRSGKAGTLGVEGMRPEVLLESLRRAGATFSSGDAAAQEPAPITKADMVDWGLSGGDGSARRRQALLHRLGLPRNLSANALLEMLRVLYTKEEVQALVRETE